MKILLLILLVVSCSSRKPAHKPSGYRPVILPQALPMPPAAEPGSAKSPQMQQLPPASP